MTDYDLNLQIAIETLEAILRERNDIYLDKALRQLNKMLDEEPIDDLPF